MKKLFFAFCLLCSPAFALLAPIHQSIKEIKALLDSPELLQDIYPGDSIQNIDREGNSYIIKSQKTEIVVDVIYTPMKMPGAQQFQFVFHEPTPRS